MKKDKLEEWTLVRTNRHFMVDLNNRYTWLA